MSPAGRSDHRPLYVGLIVLAAILVAALALAAVILAPRPGPGHPISAPDHTVSAPRAGRQQARLDLVSGVDVVTVRSTDLGDDLYRIGTPAGSAQVPRVVDQDGSQVVRLDSAGPDSRGSDSRGSDSRGSDSRGSDSHGPDSRGPGSRGPAGLEILLNSAVTWRLRLGGGAGEARLDLRAGPVAEVDIASGVSSVELWLPRPAGTIPVRETGGAATFTVHLPPGVPVRTRLAGGAGSATIDGITRTGLAGGTELDGSGSGDGYDLDAIGGLSALRVDRF